MKRNLYNKIVENIYQSSLEKEHWDSTLASIAQALDYEGIAIVPDDQEETLLKISSSTNKQSDFEYYNHYISQNPMRTFSHLYKGKQIVVSDLNYISKDKMAKSAYYVDFLNKYGCAYSERLHISEKNVSCTIAAQRGLKYLNRDTPPELTIDLFSNHIKMSLLFLKKMNLDNSLNYKLSGLYDRMDFGVCLITHDNKILFLNRSIQENKNDLFYVSKDNIIFYSNHNENLWRKLLNSKKDIIYSNIHSEITTFIDKNNHKILARIMPLPAIIADHFGTTARCQMVFFYDLKPSQNNIIDLLRSLGLSHSEAQLAQRIGHLETLKESAQNLCISYETARSSLKKVFSKLNINTQNELVSLVTKLSFIR
ncbi:hypothetical protein NKW53_12885 [Acetobacter orientalis]|uniref:helix-turn-helix transcriptional regulator n=1 Tax=Acetobacter orientalis TaxID=146474 RepID=UPI00209FAFF5|nr:hypothetical protein [Acetobacter orientalis]MCP1216958.1 hypothetical protein [Acetobacter orientalis]MCP1219862.1 hypothetical protein [Acetobacter orientalis]